MSGDTASNVSQQPTGMKWRAELYVILVGLAVRVVYLILLKTTSLWEYYRADHAFYKAWGVSISAGEISPGHVFEQGPFYAYWLGTIYSLFGDSDTLVLSLQMVAGIHLGCIVFWIARRLCQKRVAMIAGILTVTYGPLLYFEGLVMKSWLSPWLTTFVCLLTLRMLDAETENRQHRRPQVLECMLAGGCIGVLCLVRESHVLLLLPMSLTVLFGMKSTRLPRRITLIAVTTAVCFLTTLPATIHNEIVARQFVWVTSGGGEVLFMGWGPEANGYYQNPSFVRPDPFLEHEDFRLEASRRLGKSVTYSESSTYWRRASLAEIWSHPIRSVGLAKQKLVIALNDYEVPDSDFYAVARQVHPMLPWLPTWNWMIGLAVIGFIAGTIADKRFLVLAGFIGVHILTILITYNFSRFRLGASPLLCLFAAVGIERIVFGSGRSLEFLNALSARLLCMVIALLVSLWSWMPPPGFREQGFADLEQSFMQTLQTREPLTEHAKRLVEEADGEVNSAAVAYEIGLAWMRANQPFRAEKWFLRGLKIDDSHANCWLYLGVLQGQRGQFKVAANAFQNAIQIEPENADLWANLGNAYFHQALNGSSDFKQRTRALINAEDAYRQGLKIQPDHEACMQGVLACQRFLSQR